MSSEKRQIFFVCRRSPAGLAHITWLINADLSLTYIEQGAALQGPHNHLSYIAAGKAAILMAVSSRIFSGTTLGGSSASRLHAAV